MVVLSLAKPYSLYQLEVARFSTLLAVGDSKTNKPVTFGKVTENFPRFINMSKLSSDIAFRSKAFLWLTTVATWSNDLFLILNSVYPIQRTC